MLIQGSIPYKLDLVAVEQRGECTVCGVVRLGSAPVTRRCVQTVRADNAARAADIISLLSQDTCVSSRASDADIFTEVSLHAVGASTVLAESSGLSGDVTVRHCRVQ